MEFVANHFFLVDSFPFGIPLVYGLTLTLFMKEICFPNKKKKRKMEQLP